MVILNERSSPPFHSLIYDILFRPVELEDVPMWDQFSLYEKTSMTKNNKQSNDEDTDGKFLQLEFVSFLRYLYPYV
jgi:hypothetical protein